VTGQQKFSYAYSGTFTFNGQTKRIDGTAWSRGRCDEVRLRAVAVRDLSQSEGVPLAGIEITEFWFSEMVTDVQSTGTEGADPFRPRDTSPDPFRPHDVPDT
jgi:hypothetical protein